jgi:chemotaxis signal transduction protein
VTFIALSGKYAIDIVTVQEIRRYDLLLLNIEKPPTSAEVALGGSAVR